MRADVPLQFYALLYIPSNAERNMLSPRKEPGLKLYARKVLIQEYGKDLLPEYLQFVQGVVDSEDLPLNVNRESVQANKVMANLKKTITGKVLSELKRLAQKNKEEYLKIYAQFGRFIKQGIAVAPQDRTDVEPCCSSPPATAPDRRELFSLEDYIGRMAADRTTFTTSSARISTARPAARIWTRSVSAGIEVLFLSIRLIPSC